MPLLFGGSFNPIHNGHVAVAADAARRLRVDTVILLPCATPPHKDARQLAASEHRLAMCRLAARDPRWQGSLSGHAGVGGASDVRLGEPLRVVVDEWETRQSGPNYTLHTIRHFRETLGAAAELYWLIGLDSLNELHTWHRVGELASLCTLVTVARPGYAWTSVEALRKLVGAADLERIRGHILDTPMVDISATDIRERIRGGRAFEQLVPDGVAAYIRQKRLYLELPSG